MEYGSVYNLHLIKEKNLFFLSGRIALKTILNNILNQDDKCLIPNYLCESIYNCFNNYDYYKIDDNFNINFDFLKELILKEKYKIIYIINFFGYIDSNINNIKNLCSEKKIYIIEDYTHNIYSNNLYGDVCLCSYRKSLETPFGCIVIDKNNILNITQEAKFNLFYTFLVSFKLSLMILKNFKHLKFIWRPLLLSCENNLDNITYSNFDYINNFFYRYYDLNINMNIRKKNFKVLHNNLKIKTLDKFINTYFTYPLFVKNKIYRDSLVKKLSEKKIYCPYYWCLNFDNEKKCNNKLVDNMLCIPIDQRYNENDMIYISDIINLFLDDKL
jgi:hypothetical protein